MDFPAELICVTPGMISTALRTKRIVVGLGYSIFVLSAQMKRGGFFSFNLLEFCWVMQQTGGHSFAAHPPKALFVR